MMADPCLIGVDVGTSATKAILIRADGAILAEATTPSRLIQPTPQHVEQDPDEIVQSVIETIAQCVDRSGVPAGEVAALALDGQMAGIMMVDHRWDPVTPYDSWLDTRCSAYVERMREHSNRITALCGGPPTYSHGPRILWWMHEHPEVFERAYKVIQPAAYAAGRLAGLRGDDAFIDPTYLHFSCLADARRREWSEELCGLFSVPVGKLPRIVQPWEVVGRLTAEMAARTGLREGTPVVAGAGDQAAAMLGAGVVRPGTVYDAAGTASVLAACIPDFMPDTRTETLLTTRMIPDGLWYAIGYINGGGLNLKWFRDELLGAEGGGTSLDYPQLDELASRAPPGSDGLLFVPHLGGRVCPNQPDLRGSWLGFTWLHGTSHFYRALLESVAYEYAIYLAIARELVPEFTFEEVRVVGGGSRSAVWNQIKADVLGIPYVQLNQTEAGALGAAILAGYGVGAFSDWEDAVGRFVRVVRRFEPNPEVADRYQGPARLYRALLEEHAPLWKRLAEIQSGTSR